MERSIIRRSPSILHHPGAHLITSIMIHDHPIILFQQTTPFSEPTMTTLSSYFNKQHSSASNNSGVSLWLSLFVPASPDDYVVTMVYSMAAATNPKLY